MEYEKINWMWCRIVLILVFLSGNLYSQVDEYSNYDIKIIEYLKNKNSDDRMILKKDSTVNVFFCRDQFGLSLKDFDNSLKRFRVDSLKQFYDSIKALPFTSQFIKLHSESYQLFYPSNVVRFFDSNGIDSDKRNGVFIQFSNEMKFENLSIVRVYISIPKSCYFADYFFVFNKKMEIIHFYGDISIF